MREKHTTAESSMSNTFMFTSQIGAAVLALCLKNLIPPCVKCVCISQKGAIVLALCLKKFIPPFVKCVCLYFTDGSAVLGLF